jgi:hypothetical protein
MIPLSDHATLEVCVAFMFRFILSDYYFAAREISPTTETRKIDDQDGILVGCFIQVALMQTIGKDIYRRAGLFNVTSQAHILMYLIRLL